MPDGFWPGIADIGVLGLDTDEGGSGVLEIAAAMETLGSFGALGPLVGTFAAGALLDAGQFRSAASAVQHSTTGTSDGPEAGIRSADIHTPRPTHLTPNGRPPSRPRSGVTG